MTSYPATVLGDAPTGYWRLGETSGTTAADSSPNAMPGSYIQGYSLGQPGLLVNDPDATSVVFTLGASGMQVPDDPRLAFGDTITLEAWVLLFAWPLGSDRDEPSPLLAGDGVVIGRGTNAALMRVWNNGQVQFLKSQAAQLAASPAGTIQLQTTYHVVCTKDGPDIHIYVDGEDVTTAAADATLTNNAEPLVVGGPDANYLAGFPGFIQEAAVYPVALTAEQVANHYVVGITPPGIEPEPPEPDTGLSEEARAALWRAQQRRRLAYQREMWAGLAADPAPAAAVRTAWWPLVAWLHERQLPPEAPEDEPGTITGLDDIVNVGR